MGTRANQGVPGGGSETPQLMLVGEQPGDDEDKQGTPFVGPAWQLLRRAIADASLTLEEIYLTNAVKHFYWEPRGPRRIGRVARAGQGSARRCTRGLSAT